jgi:type VI secretion system protein VasD
MRLLLTSPHRPDRRTLLATGGAALLLAACQGGPAQLTVSAQSSSGMNPGGDGTDRPVTLSIIQMTGTGAFNAADVISLSQDPASALGGEFVKSDRLVLAPGQSATVTVPVDTRTTVIGVAGGFIDPAGKTVRATVPAPTRNSGLVVSVDSGGISLTPA